MCIKYIQYIDIVVQVGMELLVCAVHPIPGEFYFLWTTKLSNHGGKIGSQENHSVQPVHSSLVFPILDS
jgi:hypothetical protein